MKMSTSVQVVWFKRDLRCVDHAALAAAAEAGPVHLKQQQGIDYPLPLVDFELAHRQLKNDVSQLRKEHDLRPARGFNERRSRTGSRSRKNTPPDNQLSLFD